MLPALRRLIAAAPTDAPSAADLALRRLAQLAPDEARPLILREIQNPRRGATLKTLGSLRDAELPDLDDALAANFEASNSEIHAALVQRYATRKIASRILASAGDKIGGMACNLQASILAYFLRVDEATGSTLLDRAMTSRATGCWRFLNQIAALRMTPVVQARAIADLDNPDPDVVIAAIETWDNTDRRQRSSRCAWLSSAGTRRGPTEQRSWRTAAPSNVRTRDRRWSKMRFVRRSAPVRVGWYAQVNCASCNPCASRTTAAPRRGT